MKTRMLFTLAVCAANTLLSQVPQAMNYQAIARNSGGPIANQNIAIKPSILSGGSSGAVVYSETHSTTTDANGAFTLKIGFGTPVTGKFSEIDWGSADHYLKIEADFTGGTSYSHISTAQLLSVPYALQSGSTAFRFVYVDNFNDTLRFIVGESKEFVTQAIWMDGDPNDVTFTLNNLPTGITSSFGTATHSFESEPTATLKSTYTVSSTMSTGCYDVNYKGAYGSGKEIKKTYVLCVSNCITSFMANFSGNTRDSCNGANTYFANTSQVKPGSSSSKLWITNVGVNQDSVEANISNISCTGNGHGQLSFTIPVQTASSGCTYSGFGYMGKDGWSTSLQYYLIKNCGSGNCDVRYSGSK